MDIYIFFVNLLLYLSFIVGCTQAFDGGKCGKHSMFGDYVQFTFSDRTDNQFQWAFSLDKDIFEHRLF